MPYVKSLIWLARVAACHILQPMMDLTIDSTERDISMEEIVKLIHAFNTDPNRKKVNDLMHHSNIFDILGVSRIENCHSSFLAWLFDSNQDHGLKAYPSSLLLDLIVGRLLIDVRKYSTNSQSVDYIDKAKFLYDILCHNYRIERSRALTETHTDKNKRIDIWIRYAIKYNEDSHKSINIVIENKVESNFQRNQLNFYTDYFEKYYPNDLNLYVFIAPNPEQALKSLSKKDNEEANQYIGISYQDILTNIIFPTLQKDDIPTRTNFLLNEYVNELSKPNFNKSKFPIMAMDEQQRDILTNFFFQNKNLMILALDALLEDPNLDDEVKNSVNQIHTSIKKVNRYYLDGECIKYAFQVPGAIIRKYLVLKPEATINDIKNDLGINIDLEQPEIKSKRFEKINLTNGNVWFIKTDCWKYKKIDTLIERAKSIQINVETIPS